MSTSTTSAPAPRSRSSAAVASCSVSASRFLQNAARGNAHAAGRRSEAGATLSRAPVMMVSSSTRSATSRAIGPAVSRVWAMGVMPSCE